MNNNKKVGSFPNYGVAMITNKFHRRYDGYINKNERNVR